MRLSRLFRMFALVLLAGGAAATLTGCFGHGTVYAGHGGWDDCRPRFHHGHGHGHGHWHGHSHGHRHHR